jgi:hypothetical protein
MRPLLASSVTAALLLNNCAVVVPNTRPCHVPGVLSAGMDCAETNTGVKSRMTVEQAIAFIEPETSPSPRAGAVCQSAEDYEKNKTIIEQACRLLGKRCTYEVP